MNAAKTRRQYVEDPCVLPHTYISNADLGVLRQRQGSHKTPGVPRFYLRHKTSLEISRIVDDSLKKVSSARGPRKFRLCLPSIKRTTPHACSFSRTPPRMRLTLRPTPECGGIFDSGHPPETGFSSRTPDFSTPERFLWWVLRAPCFSPVNQEDDP